MAEPISAENGDADIRVVVLDAKQQPVGTTVLHGGLGTPLHAIGASADGGQHYSVDVTPIAVMAGFAAAVAALAVQLVAVRPRLNRRSDEVLAGREGPRSRMHHVYVVLELIKVVALLVAGVCLL